MLIAIKLMHTAIWTALAAIIVAIPALAMLRRFRWAAVLSAIVILECVILAINGGRCPLTDIAARYTPNRSANFDIYLPVWLAQHNKQIFGTLFLLGEVVLSIRWIRERKPTLRKKRAESGYSLDCREDTHLPN